MKNEKKPIARYLLNISFFMSLVMLFVISVSSPAYAAHTSTASVTPSVVKASTTYTFDVTITSTAGPDDISEVRIYHDSAPLSNPNDFTNYACYPKTGWNGPFNITGSEGTYCLYVAQTIADRISSGESEDFTFDATSPPTESCRNLHFESRDVNNYWIALYDDVCVDSDPPITTKSFDGPQKELEGVEWIDGITEVVLDAVDPEPHPVGVDKTWYVNILAEDAVEQLQLEVDPELPCRDQNFCNMVLNKVKNNPDHPYLQDKWQLYEGPFQKEEESCHVLVYYSVDELGNEEDMKVNCFFVDKTPPVLTKNVGKPSVGEPGFTWLSPVTDITFNCVDQRPHPSDEEEVCFKVSFDQAPYDLTSAYCSEYGGLVGQDGFCCKSVDENNNFIFNFNENEDSMHDLEYYCKDAVEKKTETEIQWYKVDSVAPIITKETIGPKVGACPPEPEDPLNPCYIQDHGTTIRVDVKDNAGKHDSGVDYCSWRYEVTETGFVSEPVDETVFPFDIIFPEDSTHVLTVTCYDNLGNAATDEETFLVDSIPPVTTKTYGTPWKGVEGPDGLIEWISSLTPITLTAEDEKVGVDKTYWRNTIVADHYCWSEFSGCQVAKGDGSFNEYTGPFYKPEESCHLIEYYSVDKLGNAEIIKKQCVFVDNTPPVGSKEVGQPSKPYEGKGFDYWVTTSTPITLDCDDSWNGEALHPVDQEIVYWRFSTNISGEWVKGDWQHSDDLPVEVYFPEDSFHDLEYYCTDHLGNEGKHDTEYFIVDSVPPVITKTVIGPQVGQCPPKKEGDKCYIDGITKIHVEAVDPEPHPVDKVTCNWGYKVYPDTEWKGGAKNVTPPFDIQFPEESEHTLFIKCRDALGNVAYEVEKFLVDKKPPVTTKHYEGPQYSNDVEWISNKTNITFSAYDPKPHPSGVNKTYYRISLVDDTYCNGTSEGDNLGCDDAPAPLITPDSFFDVFTELSPPKIPKESCHLIEYYSVDNVEKTEEVKRQCVFVDNTPPVPNKTVGKPKEKWDGKDANFYNISERCWSTGNDRIECWKVTKDTYIDMSCVDPEPHPVDHEKVCFTVEVDADDRTEEYCKSYSGSYNETGDGFCCLDRTIEDFKFLERTEHELEYYCVDALGNKGELDIEKFKVIGKSFKIELNKKWNLLSVPFVLLEDNITMVFEDIKEDVESVWTYDAKTNQWYVYRPGAEGTNNLEKVTPGWGYWVMAYNSTELVIGGDLYNPAVTPTSRDLKTGWNLIGPYGVEDELIDYEGPDGNGDEAYCALYTLRNEESIYPPTKWSALVGYWEPYDPEFAEYGICDHTDLGAGYWVFMDEDKKYARSTVCPDVLIGMLCGGSP